VYFTLGGADANETAVKLARWAQRKPQGLIVTRERSYHGASYAGIALSGDARTEAQKPLGMRGVVHVPPPYAYRCPFGGRTEEESARLRGERGRLGHRTRGARARGRRADGSGRRHERHRGAGRVLARGSRRDRVKRRVPDRGRSDDGFGRCGEWFAWQRHGEAGRRT
jgi:taurine--2-oxoglutarate transaminase